MYRALLWSNDQQFHSASILICIAYKVYFFKDLIIISFKKYLINLKYLFENTSFDKWNLNNIKNIVYLVFKNLKII
jgi:hypothetical protein